MKRLYSKEGLTLLAVINHNDIYDVVCARNSALQYCD